MMSRRFLVTGARGMLGREVVSSLRGHGAAVTAAGRTDLDITDEDACAAAVRGHDVVVNAAAWTAVDAAETHEAEAFRGNALGPAALARAAATAGARLVHVSTDYVFAGDATTPYVEGAPTSPRSAYGRTKLAGEWAVAASGADHLVVRTAWLYGDGPCFPRTVARLLRERETITVVDDQRGQPTWARDVADLVRRLVEADAPSGTYHATASGSATWRDLAQQVALCSGADPERVRPCTTADYPTPAVRPAWSVLGHDALAAAGVEPVGPWDERWRAAAEDGLLGRG